MGLGLVHLVEAALVQAGLVRLVQARPVLAPLPLVELVQTRFVQTRLVETLAHRLGLVLMEFEVLGLHLMHGQLELPLGAVDVVHRLLHSGPTLPMPFCRPTSPPCFPRSTPATRGVDWGRMAR